MRAALFVNDSYFAYLLAEPVLRQFHHEIALVVLSTRNTGSASRLRSIYSRTSVQYFLYRSTVQCISGLLAKLRAKSVGTAARRLGIRVLHSTDFKTSLTEIRAAGPFDVGLAFNCDQKLDAPLLQLCRLGILNVHASKLPNDAGISPVLWAFARGDKSVWSTIYRMDSGIDTGPILEQREIAVEPRDTAFRLYQRVCAQSGAALAGVLAAYVRGELQPRPQPAFAGRTYWSWPDVRHQQMMRASGRKFLRARDLLHTLAVAQRD
jgi:hypothetical protein